MHNPTCQWDGCDRPAFARGLCQRCNMRARRAGTIHRYAAPPRVCDQCGDEFATGKNGKHRYCSEACQKASVESRRIARRIATLPRPCANCGEIIDHTQRSDAKFCSVRCQHSSWYAANDERLKAASAAWNRRNAAQKARANKLWYEANRERVATLNRAWREANVDKVREIGRDSAARRRARKAETVVEHFTFAQVWVRDEGRCWLCGESVDPDLIWPDPLGPSIDHVIPLVLGGSHTLANCSLSHLVCNLRKGTKIVAAPRLVGSEEESDAVATKPA